MAIREKEFILAAKLLGLSNARIFAFHILPNVISPVMCRHAWRWLGNSYGIRAFVPGAWRPASYAVLGTDAYQRERLYTFCLVAFSFPGSAILITVLGF